MRASSTFAANQLRIVHRRVLAGALLRGLPNGARRTLMFPAWEHEAMLRSCAVALCPVCACGLWDIALSHV